MCHYMTSTTEQEPEKKEIKRRSTVLVVSMPVSLRKRLKDEAIRRDQSVSSLLQEFIRDRLMDREAA